MTEIKREGDVLAGIGHDAAARENRLPSPLIASDRVDGTAVFNRAGERIGRIRRFLVNKQSGNAQYAEMEFGGFLGIGKDTYPLPWELLDFDVTKGGYTIDLTEEQLREAPCHREADCREVDSSYASNIRQHYGLSIQP